MREKKNQIFQQDFTLTATILERKLHLSIFLMLTFNSILSCYACNRLRKHYRFLNNLSYIDLTRVALLNVQCGYN